jgi:aryl-phospho-beta-D-glucosidase BglC (GH1 family)
VNGMVDAGLNAVRVPVGSWIIEDIAGKSNELYAEGGLDELVCICILYRLSR